jgi:hypothetical protein
MYQKTAEKINFKLSKLEVFARFLEMAREENQDEFKEVQDLLSRYKTLSNENERLSREKELKDEQLR